MEITRDANGVAFIACLGCNGHEGGNVLVDDDKWAELMRFEWVINTDKKGSTFTSNDMGDLSRAMPRYILKQSNAPGGRPDITHVNGDWRDNRVANLRLSPPSGARTKCKGTTSGHHGVSKAGKGWTATMCKDGVSLRTKFPLEVQAAMAFNEFAKHFYGEHARELNVIGAADMLAHGDLVRSHVNARLAAGQAPAAPPPVVVVPPPPVQDAQVDTSRAPPIAEQCAASLSNPSGIKRYVGVSRAPADMPPGWHAHATQGGRTLSAAFDTEVQAAMAYNDFAEYLYGSVYVRFNKLDAAEERANASVVAKKVNAKVKLLQAGCPDDDDTTCPSVKWLREKYPEKRGARLMDSVVCF